MLLIQSLLAYLLINVLYNSFFSIASLLKPKRTSQKSTTKKAKILVMIPAYKEDEVIIDSAKQALEQKYPKNNYEVVIIADQLQPSTLRTLDQLNVTVEEVHFEKSTKAKALNSAMRNRYSYDVAVVLDADNIMEADFLEKVNRSFQNGCQAMQGHRVAKNTENNLSVLDAISEEINNNIFRKGHVNVGLSSALIGSGMAFHFPLFKHLMSGIKAIGGFDKELEIMLLKKEVRIHYLEDALVFDEKVSQSENFDRQRTRWIAAQIRYGVNYIGLGLNQLLSKGNFNLFDKTLQFLLLPRLILLGTLTLFLFCSLFSSIFFPIAAGLFIANGVSLLVATPGKYFQRTTLKSMALLPELFFRMIKTLSRYNQASKSFLHTTHSSKQLS